MPAQTIVSYTSRSKCLRTAMVLLFPMGMIMLPALLMKNWLWLLLPGISLPAIVPFWAFCLYRAFVRVSAVSLSLDGIHESSWVFGAGLIKWNELSDISTVYYGPNRWLLLITHDPRPIWDRMSTISSLFSRFQSMFVRSPFMVPEHLIEGSLEDLRTKIQKYRETNVKATSNQAL